MHCLPLNSMAAAALVAELMALVTELKRVDRCLFPHAKEEQKIDQLLSLTKVLAEKAASLPEGATPVERAAALYCQGHAVTKALESDEQPPDTSPHKEQGVEAVKLLEQAVKLDPTLVVAWNALAERCCVTGEFERARQCVDAAVKQESNAETLRIGSFIERSKPEADVPMALAEAKKAVALGFSDAESWFALGCCHLKDFFSGSGEPKSLRLACSAFTKAEANEDASIPNPDVYYNRAQVHRYLEQYSESVADFERAGKIDPQLQAPKEIDDTSRFVKSVADAVAQRGFIKPKRLGPLLQTMATKGAMAKGTKETGKPKTEVKISELAQDGPNPGKKVTGVVVAVLAPPHSIPLTYVIVDSERTSIACSVFNIAQDRPTPQVKDVLTVAEPDLRMVEFSRDGKQISYPCVRVEHPGTLLRNGKPMERSVKRSVLTSGRGR